MFPVSQWVGNIHLSKHPWNNHLSLPECQFEYRTSNLDLIKKKILKERTVLPYVRGRRWSRVCHRSGKQELRQFGSRSISGTLAYARTVSTLCPLDQSGWDGLFLSTGASGANEVSALWVSVNRKKGQGCSRALKKMDHRFWRFNTFNKEKGMPSNFHNGTL
jgi:hypothetical protein